MSNRTNLDFLPRNKKKRPEKPEVWENQKILCHFATVYGIMCDGAEVWRCRYSIGTKISSCASKNRASFPRTSRRCAGACADGAGDSNACVRTVHRLDRVVSGLMVLARSKEAASALSREIQEKNFEKEYMAVVHGKPETACGTMADLLWRDPMERKTYVTATMGKDVREAVLDYVVLGTDETCSLVQIALRTGRTHQIRAQFSSRGLPLWGDRKYGGSEEVGPIALWSWRLSFRHRARDAMEFLPGSASTNAVDFIFPHSGKSFNER